MFRLTLPWNSSRAMRPSSARIALRSGRMLILEKVVLRCLAWVATISVWKHEIEFGCEQVNHGFEVAD